MSKYEVDFHVYGYHKDVGELISAKDAESAIAAICVDIQIDDAILEKRIADLEAILIDTYNSFTVDMGRIQEAIPELKEQNNES